MALVPDRSMRPVAQMSLVSRLAGPIIIAAVLVMLIVPLSPAAISFMFALNISTGLVILAAAIYIPQPSDFLAFPSVLLGTTLMRLALNVATARAILLRGYTGTDAAGKVIESFGNFVVGGDYVVGFIIFGILIIINFVVVTKGAGRVAEVSARFMLDSLPGRQMAIDADVNAGSLTPKQAEARRMDLRREADFFGAMDGASKFVRGDVVAAMIILVINLVGGLLIGTLQHGLPIGVATQTYTLLTVGDGVAAQIPSLAVSVAAGLVVTRVATGEDIGTQIIGQLARYPQAVLVAAGLLAVLGVMPGMAHLPFLGFAAALGLLGWRMLLRQRAETPLAGEVEAKPEQPVVLDGIETVSRIDPFGLEIGFALVPLLGDKTENKPTLLTRLTAVRKVYGRKMGFIPPHIHVRDSGEMGPQAYRFTLRGATLGSGSVNPHEFLAMETEHSTGKPPSGRPTKDPVFGQNAYWITERNREAAEISGYSVIDPQSVIATHLQAILDKNGWEMLGRTELDELFALHAKLSPKMVEEVRTRFSTGLIRQTLQSLLAEDIPIKDFSRIIEAMVDCPDSVQKDPEKILIQVRIALGRFIISRFLGTDNVLRVITLDPKLESVVSRALMTAQERGLGHLIEPNTSRMIREAVVSGKAAAKDRGFGVVLAVQSAIRHGVARCLTGIIDVIAAEEIPEDARLVVVDSVRPPPQTGAAQDAAA